MSPWIQKPDGSTAVEGPKSANHHWWPRSLSAFWKGSDGNVGCIRNDAEGIKTIRTQHKNFGGQRDGHSQLYGDNRHASPWNRSEEHAFNDVDSSMGELVKSLEEMVANAEDVPLTKWHPVSNDVMLSDALAPAILSLCLRNPHTRFLASSMGRELLGYERGSQVDRNVSLSNILASFRVHAKQLRGRGRFGIFVARESEFIYGDGCFHNVHTSGDFVGNIRMLVPMTPRIAVGYLLPSRYMTEPMFCVMNLGVDVVASFNNLVQIYSEKELFFSNIEPELIPEFKNCEFLRILPEHNPALYWLNKLPGL